MAVVLMVDEDAASGVAGKYSIGLVEPQVPALALGTGSSARSGNSTRAITSTSKY